MNLWLINLTHMTQTPQVQVADGTTMEVSSGQRF
jgi:hypothetical protein